MFHDNSVRARITARQRRDLEQLSTELRIDKSALIRYAIETALPLGEKLSRKRHDALVDDVVQSEHDLADEGTS